MKEGTIVTILHEEFFIGEDGNRYVSRTKEILTPRKTFLKGEISGKYRGDRIFLENPGPNRALFDFEIYEATVECGSRDNFRKEKPFKVKGKIEFPREKLPNTIPVTILSEGHVYDVNILEPALYNFESIRKYRQVHGTEAFGHFTAFITGYIFDYERTEITIVEKDVPITEPEVVTEVLSPLAGVTLSKSNAVGNYFQKQKADRYGNTVNYWQFKPVPEPSGCFSGIIGSIALVGTLLFLVVLLPGFGYLLAFAAIMMLLTFLRPLWKWIVRIGVVFFLILFGLSLFRVAMPRQGHSSSATKDDAREVHTAETPAPVDTEQKNTATNRSSDSLIKRFRAWDDYAGHHYEGYYTVRRSDFNSSHYHKENIGLHMQGLQEYNAIVADLGNYDTKRLAGLYHMLDSIGAANRLTKRAFAEMTVSMVQDIPYSLVLEDECNSGRYGDSFIKRYLSRPDAQCDPYQRFGINTPVEFITNLKGDCDTRTLLLYTVLAHYQYDVVLLSSEVYSHSLLGIALPFDGIAYNNSGRRYIAWETTNVGIPPGKINPEMTNMNNWRISLKSSHP